MMDYLDSPILHFGWHVARNLDALMLSLWWVLPTVSSSALILLQMRSRFQWRPGSAFISLGLVPLLVLSGVALVTPLAGRSYSIGGLLLAVVYVLVWVGFFHTIGFAFSAVWARKDSAPSRSRILLVFAALHACGAWWVEQVAREHHSGPFFPSGG